MSSPRNPGESFEAYRLRLCKEKREEVLHVRGNMVFASTELIEKADGTYKRTRQYIAPKKIKASKDIRRCVRG
jgi:hypothetical protein